MDVRRFWRRLNASLDVADDLPRRLAHIDAQQTAIEEQLGALARQVGALSEAQESLAKAQGLRLDVIERGQERGFDLLGGLYQHAENGLVHHDHTLQWLRNVTAHVERMTRESRTLLGALSLPPAETWNDGPRHRPGKPGAEEFPNSTLCRQESFERPVFHYWIQQLQQQRVYHRKLWEVVFICQALWERGAIRPGARGLGFGVGREPLTAWFASEGCHVVATDLAGDQAEGAGWMETAQHAAGLEALRYPLICPDPVLDRNVRFRDCDMNNIPADLTGFDFCWSACAFEHLGSIEAGLAFVERSVECLRPGGWAIHTTEYNLSSNEQTLDNDATVLFRRRDLETLADRLRAKGHRMAPLDLEPGTAPLERYIDVPPYRVQPHLRLALEGYSATSVGVIVQRGE